MRAKCGGCQSSFEFPDAAKNARCPACAVLWGAPVRRGLSGSALSEPDDLTILGLRKEPDAGRLREAWAAFLTTVPADRFPAAFAQGRAAYERIRARAGRTVLSPHALPGGCVACAESNRCGFPACLACGREQPRATVDTAPAIPAAGAKVQAALREAEARWRVRRAAETLAAAGRGLAEPELPSDLAARQRLSLLAANAKWVLGKKDEARNGWSALVRLPEVGSAARFALAATALAEGDAAEVIHHLGPEARTEPVAKLLAAIALDAHGNVAEAVALCANLDGAERPFARWIAGGARLAAGDAAGALAELGPILGDLSAASAPASLGAGPLFTAGVALAEAGKPDGAVALLQEGMRRAPADPSFPAALGRLALRMGRFDEAARLLDAGSRAGDDGPTHRGAALVAALRSGGGGAEALAATEDPELLRTAARLFEKDRRIADAAKALSRAAERDPSPHSTAELGALLVRHGAPEKATDLLRRARRLGDGSATTASALASALLARGAFDEAAPLLAELPADSPAVRRNRALTLFALALAAANEGREDDAVEQLDEALAVEPSILEERRALVAELYFRAGARRANRGGARLDSAAELLARAVEVDPSHRAARLTGAEVEISRGGAGAGERAIALLAPIAVSSPRATLATAMAEALAGRNEAAKARLDLLLPVAGELAPRVQYVRGLVLGVSGQPDPGRRDLAAAATALAGKRGLERLGASARQEELKLRAVSAGGNRIEAAIAARGADVPPELLLLHGLVLASTGRFDEAASALEKAGKDRGLRAEADRSRQLVQLSRIAALLSAGQLAEGLRLFVKLRPGLPQDPQVDLWLASLESEGVPFASLRAGDGRAAVNALGGKVQGWRKAKDGAYFELVRALAVAAHRSALAAERAGGRVDAERYWKVAADRYVELSEAEPFWDAFAAHGRELFPALEPETIAALRTEIVDRWYVGALREAIGWLRTHEEEIAAAQRFGAAETVAKWRLSQSPGDAERVDALATCHAQRLILYSNSGMWEEARRFGELACETDPDDPVHFNNMAEVYGAEAQPILARLDSEINMGNGGPHLRPLAAPVVELLALALAWNPFHQGIGNLHRTIAGQLGFSGPGMFDARIRRANELRARIPEEKLRSFSMQMASGAQEQGEEIDVGVTPAQVAEIAAALKRAGLRDPQVIYDAILKKYPELAKVPKEQVMNTIVNA